MSTKSLSRLRSAAYSVSFSQRHVLSHRQAKLLQCTAEHLLARQDGGIDSANNIVAACWYCNQQRHRPKVPPAPDMNRQRVQQKMKRGGWHRLKR